MTFTIEPMLTLGDPVARRVGRRLDRGHARRRRSAQFEHMLVVTADGVEILTVASDGRLPSDVFAEATATH